ncbi:basic leucine zipper 34-like [Macadamia integrifolia]|uniref:basic leucine zipper 34-like n=1 Tax=Macadamia integrifolia TaxID=60698 RepID=UPI001C4F7A72|nr:basic leucine zipper 34-like [Macadamia integrifolia]
MKVIMQPHKEADHPVSNDPFAVPLRKPTNGITGINLGTTSLKTPALEPTQGINENENSSPSFGENYFCSDNGLAAILGPSIKLKIDENLYQHKWIRNIDPNMDPKKLRRTLGNRLSAQKARLRQLEYISQLEEHINNLRVCISSLNFQVSEKHTKHTELSNENDAIRDKIARLSDEHEIKYAQNKWLEQEIHRMWANFQQQQQQQEVQQTYHLQLQHQQLLLPPEQIQQQQQQQLEMAECELGQGQVFNNNYPNLAEYELGQDQLFNNNYPNLAEFELGQDELFNLNYLMNLDEKLFNIPMDQLLNL